MTGLANGVRACLFDMDGVLTATTELHRAAWRDTFDAVLREVAQGQEPFSENDYETYVDGRPRYDGVREFLSARNLMLPEGYPEDSPDAQTVHGIGNRKNNTLLRLLDEQGVRVYPGSRRYLETVRAAGILIGVVTSSANGAHVLHAAGLSEFVATLVDGTVIDRDGLHGKPEPDSFLAAARNLAVTPADSAVFEDALAGVQAGRAGGFGCVVGVDRTDQAAALRDNGARIVVRDLAELLEHRNDH